MTADGQVAAATVAGAIIGLAGAAAFQRTGVWARLVQALAVLALVVPAPAVLAGPAIIVIRCAAAVLLITVPLGAGRPPGLRRAAQAAGATPFQAWRHTALAATWRPVAIGIAAACLTTLAQTQAAPPWW